MKIPTPEELSQRWQHGHDPSPTGFLFSDGAHAMAEAIAIALLTEADPREDPVFRSALEIVAEHILESIRREQP